MWSNHQRYGVGERWTSILKNSLGDEFEIIEEGLEKGVDGVRLTKESHKRLADKLKLEINKIYK